MCVPGKRALLSSLSPSLSIPVFHVSALWAFSGCIWITLYLSEFKLLHCHEETVFDNLEGI